MIKAVFIFNCIISNTMNNNFRLKSFNSAPKERYQTDLKVVLNSSRNADHQVFSHTSGSRDLHVNGEIS